MPVYENKLAHTLLLFSLVPNSIFEDDSFI